MPTKGSVVIIPDNSKIKTKWQIGRIVDTIKGKNGVLKGYKDMLLNDRCNWSAF